MTDVQTTGVELVRFPCVPWTMGEGRIAPIPGTWTLAPESLCKQDIRGILCCPNRTCKRACLIPFDHGTVDNGALVLNNFQCAGCKMLCNARLLEWDTRKLFCVVYELVQPDESRTQRKEYLHAEHRAQALMFFSNGTGCDLDRNHIKWYMVDCGIAIGYFGQESDKDQVNLTV